MLIHHVMTNYYILVVILSSFCFVLVQIMEFSDSYQCSIHALISTNSGKYMYSVYVIEKFSNDKQKKKNEHQGNYKGNHKQKLTTIFFNKPWTIVIGGVITHIFGANEKTN